MNVNISWFNILVLKLFSNKNGWMAKLYNTLIMLKIVFIHVHCIHLCMLETYSYNNVSHTIEFFCAHITRAELPYNAQSTHIFTKSYYGKA